MTDGANRGALPYSCANRHRIALNKQQMRMMLSLGPGKARILDTH
jgi:hypothetical protein